ncbi:DUF3800 domain-containing protein [Flavobacterium sp. MC2016-06]|jgi:hypothetical protein|uniref:DUF3800 domain-containing protein n=1 Tax=Flavobacterium sp. MC2016-06 TaxID=2676308 RepID=UPI0012BA5878|nr:DUF3800 domain-containing protein [Flavobacterium sp. MC2016-06]MBU3859154.1 DUF3800 domain-containing protein [Flavobacterium sp. MC2016-06]
MKIYIDESGDLGWTLDKPNRHGGSSKYITITAIIIADDEEKYISRFISYIYKKYNLTPNIEKKGANFIAEHSSYITSQITNKIINKSISFKIISITVNKAKVYDSLRKDKNIFYNYVLGLLLKPEIIQHNNVEIVLDKRTIKVSHGESFPDYIKTEVWGQGLDINISCEFLESTKNKMIWFADWYANFIWRKHEDNESSSYDLLEKFPKDRFVEKKLFF